MILTLTATNLTAADLASAVAVQTRQTASPSTPQKTVSDADELDSIPLPPGVYRAGKDVDWPRVIHDERPNYTSEAMKEKIAGKVRLACIVGVDGSVGDVKIVRSLDALYGLDEAAVRAAKLWRFEPTLKNGVPVPVMITIDMAFVMSAQVVDAKDHGSFWAKPLRVFRIW